ncbi:MAG: Gram-negative bacterial tonB protein, partial [Candidatus Scalindua rubra]
MLLAITSEPKVILKKGESSIKLHLIPSAASVASTKSINDISKDVKQIEEQTIEDHKPLQEPINSKQEQNKVKNNVVQKKGFDDISKAVSSKALSKVKDIEYPRNNLKKEDAIYGTEYFKTQEKNNIKQSQNRQTDISTVNSKEIIADVREKGVTTSVIIKNIFKPLYPLSCQRRGHEGTTVLEVTILSNGTCGN